jgi:aarF domain-containing kinase
MDGCMWIGGMPSSLILSEQNAERLAEGLCRMRGAALKIGQMLSIQDESMLPPQLADILQRVRSQADIMPRRQLTAALIKELGDDWQSRVTTFEWEPFAAASIGQVHRATLVDDNHTNIVMKVQYPGVATSISSDIRNVNSLIQMFNIVPKGMFLDDTLKVVL